MKFMQTCLSEMPHLPLSLVHSRSCDWKWHFPSSANVCLSLTSQNVMFSSQKWNLSLSNLHVETPPGLHRGRGHSVRMWWWSIWEAKHVGNAGQKKSRPEWFLCPLIFWRGGREGALWNEMTANEICAFPIALTRKRSKRPRAPSPPLARLGRGWALGVLYMIHYHLHNWAVPFG